MTKEVSIFALIILLTAMKTEKVSLAHHQYLVVLRQTFCPFFNVVSCVEQDLVFNVLNYIFFWKHFMLFLLLFFQVVRVRMETLTD